MDGVLMKKNLLFLDVDGVVFDSNRQKEKNISKAVRTYCDEVTSNAFIEYFIQNNGLPREIKIHTFFKNFSDIADSVLRHYNQLNAHSMKNVDFTRGGFSAIQELSQRFNLVALSGGQETELYRLFFHKAIDRYFFHIRGGPLTKEANLRAFTDYDAVLYVGDSKADFDASWSFNIPFCFMSEYTQFEGWETFFADHPEVTIIRYLSDLTI